MRAKFLGILLAFSSFWAWGEQKTVTGIVQNVVQQGRIKTVLENSKQLNADAGFIGICTSDISVLIGQLENMTVQIEGAWDEAGAPCFAASAFRILALDNGRRPYIGTLRREGESYAIRGGEKEVVIALKDSPKSFANLEGKQLIVDMKEVRLGNKIKPYVVTYNFFPKD